MRLENLYPFTEWQVLWLVSFPGLPHLQFLITFSMQEKVGEGPSHGKNNPGLLPLLLYIVSDQKLEALGAKLLEVELCWKKMLWYCYYATMLAHILQKWHIL